MNSTRTAGIRLFASMAACFVLAAFAQSSKLPAITGISIEGTNCVVTVSVPEGIQRVTLETSDRPGRGGWAPRIVLRPELKAGVATFWLPTSTPLQLLRVRADATEPLPPNFFNGTSSFSSPSDQNLSGTFDNEAGPTTTTTTTGVTPGTANGTETREVVESDIWQIRGNTLYFFNQYRGLQVIDIADPDHSFIRGSVNMPAVGEQMYVLGNGHVVLLARDGCSYDQSQILLVAATNASPTVVARLPVSGTILESRLVGTALYVASQTSRPVDGTTNSVWEWGTQVSAFDLADPDKPVARNTIWYSGYGNVVTATDTYLFVATESPTRWYESNLRLIDISDPTAAMIPCGSITTRGRIPDKFKVHYNASVLATISEDRSGTTGAQLVTRLETFYLPDPRTGDPANKFKLGELELGHGEQLHATRFDANRVYVVTFFRVDPLWVVDFSNPMSPRIAGSIEVPGWSTFIQPLGDRLVTLGVETNRVSVSLYDVADAAAPTRLSRVTLGTNYSWSEANYDEKAFAVLADAGLVLVPFSGDAAGGYTSALQLIDYTRSTLRARGQIVSSTGLSYRRATVFKDRILSLSGWELTTVNAIDRDNPVITGELLLAESVDRLVLAGDYLVQFSGGSWWDATTPVVSVTPTSDPNRVLIHKTLPALPLLGAAKQGDYLYVAQGSRTWTTPSTNTVVLTVFSLPALPDLQIASQIVTNTGPIGWSREWQPLWPKPGLLVWAGNQNYWPGPFLMLANATFMDVSSPMGLRWPYQPYHRQCTGDGHLVAFDITQPKYPVLAAEVDLNGTNRYGFSRAFADSGLIYISHQLSAHVPDPSRTNAGKWVYQSFLDVVDFSDPGAPLVREPVNIPNSLVGVSRGGALLFTRGYQWNTYPTTDWREYIQASAYDGVAAHLIDSLALPTGWPHPSLVVSDKVLVGNPGSSDPANTIAPALETWAISDTARFIRVGSVKLGSSISDLAGYDQLLVGYDAQSLLLFDATSPSSLLPIGAGKPNVCWWWPSLGGGDGNLADGFWMPLGAYGVSHVPRAP